MIVLDTNVVSEVLKPAPDERVVSWLSGVAGDVAITAVTVAELLAGVRRLPDGRRKAAIAESVDSALRPFRGTRAILSFDEAAAREYADVRARREAAGSPISALDAQVAGICRANEATCATRNTKDFIATGVELIDPWVGPVA